MRLLFLLGCLLGVRGGIRDCGTDTLFKITELSQTPETIVHAGENFTLTLKYEVPYEIIGGRRETSVSLNFIPLGTKEENLCESVECPLEPGAHDGSTWAFFPSGVSGTLVSKINWYDEKENHLLCLESKVSASSSFRGRVVDTMNRMYRTK
jgi:hypothetical protein